MKANNHYFFILMMLSTFYGFSQSFNYQAAVRNSAGDLVTNQSVGVQIAILGGSATGTALYTETHTVTTNANGVLNLAIGSGTTTDTFSAINWSLQNQWLDVAVDITGGTTYVTMGTTKLQHVPYSSYANTSGDKALSTTANVTSNAPGTLATDDFVFGSTQLDNITGTDDDNRLFFDKSKGALRAGTVETTEWDTANVGNYPTAFGIDNTASGIGSFAIGENNIVSGNHSFAAGTGNTVSEISSTALGAFNDSNSNATLAAGSNTIADSYGQISLGLFNTAVTGTTGSYVSTDRLLVIGNGNSSANKSDALTILKNGNTTLNGQLTIDGDNAGAGTSYTLPAQDGTASQVMTTDGAGVASWADATSSSGAFSTTANVTSNAPGSIATDDFVFGSTQLDNGTGTGDNARMFFEKNKGAFRAGQTSSTQWDDTNVGVSSAAFGDSNTASGIASFSAGALNVASGKFATALGNGSTASADYATAIGANTTADSYAQISLGKYNTAVAGNLTQSVPTDRLFVIGNGSDLEANDALTILKNGKVTFGGNVTINGEATVTELKTLLLPSFAANANVAVSATAINTWYEASNWVTSSATATQLHDIGNHFNETTGRFTAPVAGLYNFNAQVRIDGVNSGFVRVILAVNHNPGVTTPNIFGGFHSIQVGTAATLYETMNVGGIMKLDQGDTVSIVASSSEDTSWSIHVESGFNGYLVNKL